jgi:hypothetical protein
MIPIIVYKMNVGRAFPKHSPKPPREPVGNRTVFPALHRALPSRAATSDFAPVAAHVARPARISGRRPTVENPPPTPPTPQPPPPPPGRRPPRPRPWPREDSVLLHADCMTSLRNLLTLILFLETSHRTSRNDQPHISRPSLQIITTGSNLT